MKTIAYTRVSTSAQTEGNGLQQQRSAIASYAGIEGVEIDDWLSDAATGMSEERPEMDRLRKMVELGEVSRVIVDRMDRLGRSLAVCETLSEFFRAHNVELVSVKDCFGTGMSGTLMRQIMGAIAQYDRSMMLARMNSSKREALARGRFVGGGIPYGYRLGKPGELEIEPKAAAAVRRVFELHKLGLSSVRVAAKLNEEGVPSARGGRWYNSTVLDLVKRQDFYRARTTLHHSQSTAPVHEAIL
jgi:site-specific DNA recombinase